MASRPPPIDLHPSARTGMGAPGPVSAAILAAGAALIVVGVRRRGRLGVGLIGAGAGLALRGATSINPLARMRYAPAPAVRDVDRGPVSRSEDDASQVTAAVTIVNARDDAYRLLGERRNIAQICTWAGRDVSEEAVELAASQEPTLVTWRVHGGLNGSSTAAFTLSDAPANRGTEVRLLLAFDDRGTIGAIRSRPLRSARGAMAKESLRRFKQLAEAGELARAGEPTARSYAMPSRTPIEVATGP